MYSLGRQYYGKIWLNSDNVWLGKMNFEILSLYRFLWDMFAVHFNPTLQHQIFSHESFYFTSSRVYLSKLQPRSAITHQSLSRHADKNA